MYFDGITEEEDLKSRFRRLMVENHFESPYRDEELVDAIFQEYVAQLRRIMFSRGYKSPFERAVAMAEKMIKDAKARRNRHIKEIMDNREERLGKRIREAYRAWRSPTCQWLEED